MKTILRKKVPELIAGATHVAVVVAISALLVNPYNPYNSFTSLIEYGLMMTGLSIYTLLLYRMYQEYCQPHLYRWLEVEEDTSLLWLQEAGVKETIQSDPRTVQYEVVRGGLVRCVPAVRQLLKETDRLTAMTRYGLSQDELYALRDWGPSEVQLLAIAKVLGVGQWWMEANEDKQ